MVVFACGACGESLKKNQVEAHYYRKCRNCNVLSCLDCGKDFFGNEYEQHTKCITEEEKYSGKNYVPKPGSNKNEIKQQQWLQQVQDAVDKCQTNPRLKGILIKLKDQSNIPRKKNKFVNFLASGFHVRDPNLANQVWDMLMTNTAKQEDNSNKNDTKSDTNNVKKTDEKASTENGHNDSVETTNGTEENTVKQSKRDKKEERRKKMHKSEKKDKVSVTDGDFVENGVSEKKSKKKNKRKEAEISETTKKSKKRKRDEDDDEEDADSGDMNGSASVDNDDNGDNDDDDDDEEADNEPVKKKFKTKFNWSETVTEVLQSKGPELKIKKLRKKVLSEYLAQGCTERSEEKLWAKFDKKLKKIPEVKIVGDKVKLKNPS